MTVWRYDIKNLPKDGSTVILALDGEVRAYWDEELQTFVLSQPLHIESIRHSQRWRSP